MKIILFLLITLLGTLSLDAQKEDHIWLTGYSSNTFDTTFGGTIIDFNFDPPKVSYEFRDMSFGYANASICDENGNLLFYTDATTIMNSENNIIENGSGLGNDPYHESWALEGMPMVQGSLILPMPGSDSLYFIIHTELMYDDENLAGPLLVRNCYYSIVDKSVNNFSAKVIEKNIPIITNDTLTIGKISATKHANGRDWWIVIGRYNSNQFHTLHLSENGIENRFIQTVGNPIFSDLSGQAFFSPDGGKYARRGASFLNEPGQLDIYSFDRCNGSFYDPIHIPIDTIDGVQESLWGGVCFSPNSKILYHSQTLKVVQFDLMAENILENTDTVAIDDGFTDPDSNLGAGFGGAQLAPNGKIYIATIGNTRFMHTIHNPDSLGEACNFEQHDFMLATFNDRTVPNYANYNLKALVGSSCDTLRPIANFDYDSSSVVSFMDLSQRDPTTWFWTFGDGETSDEQNPTHSYVQNDTYNVCLVASNEAGSDTTCQTIDLLSGIDDLSIQNRLKVYPNPANQFFNIVIEEFSGTLEYKLIDLLGVTVRVGNLQKASQQLKVQNLKHGVYFLKIDDYPTVKVTVGF